MTQPIIPVDSLHSINTAAVQVAKNMGVTDLFFIVCSAVGADGTFNRAAYFEGDANKLIPTLAQLIRQRLPEPYKTRLVELIAQPEAPQENLQEVILPAEPTKWMN